MWKLISTILEAVIRALFGKTPAEKAQAGLEAKKQQWRRELERLEDENYDLEKAWRLAIARSDPAHVGLHEQWRTTGEAIARHLARGRQDGLSD